DTKPPADISRHFLSYAFPGTAPGVDWGDETLVAGSYGWWVSIDDIMPVLASLAAVDGAIVSQHQWDLMEGRVDAGMGLGVSLAIDALTSPNAPGYRWTEKTGGAFWNGTPVTTTACIFGSTGGLRPGSNTPFAPIANAPFYGALFINSDVAGYGPDI